MKAFAAPVLALLLADAGGAAQTSPCRTHPERVGPCRTVHGRLSVWNGTPSLRIWVVGTHRILGISERPRLGGSGLDSLPASLWAALGDDPFGTEVYGDFTVCPFARQRPEVMQFVCVAAARRVVVRRP